LINKPNFFGGSRQMPQVYCSPFAAAVFDAVEDVDDRPSAVSDDALLEDVFCEVMSCENLQSWPL